MNTTTESVEKNRLMGQSICQVLAAEIDKLELAEVFLAPSWDKARFSLKRDPALGKESLEALWLDENGAKLGSAVLHHDGTFFAEYDIIRPHPKKKQWFIEAVTAWGSNGKIKSEPRLLPMPE